MSENVKTDEKKVMLVKNAEDGKISAVRGIGREGDLQTESPAAVNIADLLNVNTNDPTEEADLKKSLWGRPLYSVDTPSCLTEPCFHAVAGIQEINEQAHPTRQQQHDRRQPFGRSGQIFLEQIDYRINRQSDADQIQNQSHNIIFFQ